ncbi:MAG: glycosyltransferase family 39 protein [Candidatus Levybacteria bacterium]|nr:glycosyltransferase family 39 protein [Candidatus Levybacteria bacterium]
MTKLHVLLVGIILFLSLLLRLDDYTLYPQRGATSDEYTYSFLGVSLLTNGVPISWSSFPAYTEKFDLTIDGIYFPMVQPYFDHPPLYGLLVGGWSLLFGQEIFKEIDLKTIRLVPIILSVISSLFIYLIGRKVYGEKVTIWTLLIFNTVTIFVMNTRVVVAENLLTVFLLGTIYIFVQFGNKLNTKHAILIGALCGLSFITKILGITVLLTALGFFIHEKIKPKYALVTIAIFLFFATLLLLYAKIYDWNLFWAIQSAQGSRPVGPETLFLIFTQPVVVNKIVHDGWYYLGFIALFSSLTDIKRNKFVAIPFLVYFFIMLSSLSSTGLSGWYLIPLFPLMALSVAQFMHTALEKSQWLFLIFLLFVGLSSIHFLYEIPFGLSPLYFRILLLALFAPFFVLLLFRKQQSFRKVGAIAFYVIILGNIIATITYVHPS